MLSDEHLKFPALFTCSIGQNPSEILHQHQSISINFNGGLLLHRQSVQALAVVMGLVCDIEYSYPVLLTSSVTLVLYAKELMPANVNIRFWPLLKFNLSNTLKYLKKTSWPCCNFFSRLIISVCQLQSQDFRCTQTAARGKILVFKTCNLTTPLGMIFLLYRSHLEEMRGNFTICQKEGLSLVFCFPFLLPLNARSRLPQ